MRLTLRTLLAYLDDILQPADRAGLEEKIKESDFARSLIQRMRQVCVRSDLAAPPIAGRGLARDASSVAEYLDNTMAPEQIQEFERSCLESDIYLAEVTGCHNILTMVLGQPAKVSAALRQRMYGLNQGTVMRLHAELQSQGGERAELEEEPRELPTAPSTAGAETSPARETVPADADRPMPAARGRRPAEPPLPDSRRFWIAMVLTAVIAASVTSIMFQLLDWRPTSGRSTTSDQLAQVEPDANTPAPAPQPAPETTAADQATTPPADEGTPPDGAPPAETPSPAEAAPPAEATPAAEETTPAEATPAAEGTPATDQTPGPPEASDDVAPEGPRGPDTPPATDTGDAAPDEPPDEAGVASAEPPAESSEPGTEAGDQPGTETGSGDELARADGPQPPADTPPATEPGDEPAGEPAAPDQTIVGRLLSQDQVLLRGDAALQEVTRLPPQAPLNVGDRLIALPAFRPMISATSTTIELEGGSSIELIGVDDQRVPEIVIHYGRLIIRSLATPNTRLRLRWGPQAGTLTFNDPNSAAGIEVRPYLPAGSDPEKTPRGYAVELYAMQGKVTWQTDGVPQALQAPTRLTLAPHPLGPASQEDQPAWLAGPILSNLDRRGITEMEQKLSPDRGVMRSLAELAEHRRWEIRRLALRACTHVAYFQPLISALRDKDLYSRWYQVFVPELTEAVARDPVAASTVRKTFEKTRGDAAAELYRMLWGYSREDLIGGEAGKLVEYLNHDDLDFRVLSFGNLQNITDLGLNYRPQDSQLQRKQSYERWKKKAEKGEIVPDSTAGPETN